MQARTKAMKILLMCALVLCGCQVLHLSTAVNFKYKESPDPDKTNHHTDEHLAAPISYAPR